MSGDFLGALIRSLMAGCAYLVLLSAFIVFVFQTEAIAHENRPASLRIVEQSNGLYDVVWKYPANMADAVIPMPEISGGVLDNSIMTASSVSGFKFCRWENVDAGSLGLEGRTIALRGMDGAAAIDAVVHIERHDGSSFIRLLSARQPTATIAFHQNSSTLVNYFIPGVRHILSGVDHLSFVFALVLLVRSRSRLVGTVAAFTVAHSITLILTVLGVIQVRPALIEALVALSILFAAVEVLSASTGGKSLISQHPWAIALIFGLLHGAAFAGALREIGLPAGSIISSLLLFNIGIEAGQLLFIGLILALAWMLARIPQKLPRWSAALPAYAIGVPAAYWFLDRTQTALL